MPNYCNYSLKAVGKEEDLEKLKEVMQSDYEYERQEDGTIIETDCKWKHLFRVFEADVIGEISDGEMEISGYCAWSVYSCMFYGEHSYYNSLKKSYGDKSKGTHLVELSKELNLDIEVFSEEGGMQFMEHYLIKHGAIEIEDCVEWIEEENEETGEYETVSGGFDWNFQI